SARERVAPQTVRGGDADERQNRKRQPRGFIRPKERVAEIGARQHVEQYQAQLAQQRGDEQRLREGVDRAQWDRVRPGRRGRTRAAGDLQLEPEVSRRGNRVNWGVRLHARSNILVYRLAQIRDQRTTGRIPRVLDLTASARAGFPDR